MGLFSIQLDKGEEILAVVRKNIFTLGAVYFRLFISLAILGSFYWFFPESFWKNLTVFSLGIIILLLFFLKFIIWYLENITITNKRIINIEQQSLKKRIIVEALIDDVAKASFFKEGLFQRIFNIGCLVVEIKGGGKIVGLFIKNPARFAQGINNLKYGNEQRESKLEKRKA
jgi:hypothetical protein